MCGIAGVCERGGADRAELIASRLVHRGPDADGLRVVRDTAMAHRRLSIVDLESGDQPIVADDGTTIVANGEIYNHADIRRRLGSRTRFRTASDSEAALHLYRLEGPEAMAELDGMYAVAIADDDGLYLARDPVGIKPLYTAETGDGLAFASEMSALDGTTSIRPLPPGHHRRPDGSIEPFRPLAAPNVRSASIDEHAARLRRALEGAIDKRLMADVPVGVFLSGGLDSSIIAALVRRRVPHVHSFSVGIEGSRDLEAARRVADHIGTTHHEHVFTTEDVVRALPDVVSHLESYDQDLVRSAIPTWFVSSLASRWVKVILTGEGADELFAGYRYYRRYRNPQALGDELARSVRSLHDSNLQRVDRMTMAHSLEGRVPFLDTELIETAESIPAELKMRRDGAGRPVEKWILRLACQDLLPTDIVWRTKEQFDEGSGLTDVVDAAIEAVATSAPTDGRTDVRSREEATYHRLLASGLEDPDPILATVSRWIDDRRPDQAGEPAEPAPD